MVLCLHVMSHQMVETAQTGTLNMIYNVIALNSFGWYVHHEPHWTSLETYSVMRVVFLGVQIGFSASSPATTAPTRRARTYPFVWSIMGLGIERESITMHLWWLCCSRRAVKMWWSSLLILPDAPFHWLVGGGIRGEFHPPLPLCHHSREGPEPVLVCLYSNHNRQIKHDVWKRLNVASPTRRVNVEGGLVATRATSPCYVRRGISPWKICVKFSFLFSYDLFQTWEYFPWRNRIVTGKRNCLWKEISFYKIALHLPNLKTSETDFQPEVPRRTSHV